MNTSRDTGNEKRRPVLNKQWLQDLKAQWWPVRFGESVGSEHAKRKDEAPNRGATFCVFLAGCSFAMMLAFVAIDLIETQWLDQEPWTQRAQRGDFWGGHVAAGAGMMGAFLFVAALLLQHSELKAQRQDLALHREEIKKQTDALEGQRRELAEQSRTLRDQTELILKRDDAQLMLALGEKAGQEGFPGALKARRNVMRLALSHIVERAVQDDYYALELLSLFKAGSSSGACDHFMPILRELVEMQKVVGTRPGGDGDWGHWLELAEANIIIEERDEPKE